MRLPQLTFSLFCLTILSAPPIAQAQLIGSSERYQDCMRQARSDPERGLEVALSWKERLSADLPIVKIRDRRQENAAAHCEAVALINSGRFATAAKRLEHLAAMMADDAPKEARGEILAQAGQAWFRVDKNDQAEKAQSAAIKLSPYNGEIRIDRAITRAANSRYWDAIDDLNVAISFNRGDATAYALRASAYRSLNVLSLATQDVEAALKITPDSAEALLEQGNLFHLTGDDARARQSWKQLIGIHDGAPSAEVARRNLARLDGAAKSETQNKPKN
ncbi:MAG: tetratricopeptide (TPR) repeat protein [Alphaproteobacteria bacterium]|jgi:tetratricopeptide (TPR) repeat protein